MICIIRFNITSVRQKLTMQKWNVIQLNSKVSWDHCCAIRSIQFSVNDRELTVIKHYTVYPKKYAHGFVVLCFVVVMQSLIMNSHEVFIHIHQGCFAGTGAIFRLPQCQWSKPDGYGKISQCITTTKHSKAKTVCIFLGMYCLWPWVGLQMTTKGCEMISWISLTSVYK